MPLFRRNVCTRRSPLLRRLTQLAVFLSIVALAVSAHPGNSAAQRAGAYPPDTTLVKQPQPPLAEPPLRGPATLYPDLGTSVVRAADVPHHYSKDSPWNADESLAKTNDGTILNGSTFVPTGKKLSGGPVVANEHRVWSNTDPRYVYGVHAQNRQWIRMDATNPANNVVLATFPQYSYLSFGGYEGTIDNADSGVALIGDHAKIFLINPKTGATRCSITSGPNYGTEPDATGMSQDGKYIVVNWKNQQIDAYLASDCSFHRHLSDLSSHQDSCVSTAGEQVMVGFGYGPGHFNHIYMIRLSDGQMTVIGDWDNSIRGHLSCRNIKRPGWAYVSVYTNQYDAYQAGTVTLHRIFAVKLDGSKTVENFAWDHQATPGTYDDAPVASPSPSGTRVWWKLNWDGTSSGVHSFVAGMQPLAAGTPPSSGGITPIPAGGGTPPGGGAGAGGTGGGSSGGLSNCAR